MVSHRVYTLIEFRMNFIKDDDQCLLHPKIDYVKGQSNGKKIVRQFIDWVSSIILRILMFTVFQNSHQDAENDDFDPLEEYYDPEGGYDSYEVRF